jgi:hypothetical protein
MQKTIVTMWLVLAMALVACKGSPGSQGQESSQQPSDGTPLEFKLDGAPRDRFDIVGLPAKGAFRASGKTLKISFYDLPKGTKYEIGSEKDTVQDAIMSLDIDISPQLVQANLRDLGASGKLDLGLTLKLELPDRRRGELKLPPLRMSLDEQFDHVRVGAISFGNEPEDTGASKTLVFRDSMSWEIFGQPGMLFELDWIAVWDRLPEEGTKRCTEYRKDKNSSDITLSLKKTEVTIYDRRTGSVVKKKTFNASSECPKIVARTPGAPPVQDSTVPLGDIKQWLQSEVTAKK